MTITFSVIDNRCTLGFRFVSKQFDSRELAEQYMFKYHNRCTDWYTIITDDNKVIRAYNRTGVRI